MEYKITILESGTVTSFTRLADAMRYMTTLAVQKTAFKYEYV